MPSSPMSLNISVIETRWHRNIDSIIVLHACMADIMWCICKVLRMLRINMRMRMIVILINYTCCTGCACLVQCIYACTSTFSWAIHVHVGTMTLQLYAG